MGYVPVTISNAMSLEQLTKRFREDPRFLDLSETATKVAAALSPEERNQAIQAASTYRDGALGREDFSTALDWAAVIEGFTTGSPTPES